MIKIIIKLYCPKCEKVFSTAKTWCKEKNNRYQELTKLSKIKSVAVCSKCKTPLMMELQKTET